MESEKINGLVSVIVPVYNSQKYIEQSVRSVLNGGYKNIELIAVDDGSTDNSLAILEKIAENDDRVRVFHKENGGASSARNFGLERAKGEYIYFVDSDDFLEENALETLTRELSESGADVIYFEAYNFSESDEIRALKNGFTFNYSYGTESGEKLIPELIKNRDYHAAPFLYFAKRAVIGDIRFKEGIMFEDELFSFNLLMNSSKVLCLNKKFYRRRMREGSVMTASGKGIFRFKSISAVLTELIRSYDPGSLASGKYIERIAILWQLRYEELNFAEKEKVKDEYEKLNAEIKKHNYFSSAQVKIRLKSKTLWHVYTLPNKVIRKVKKTFKR
ncbi:MAG: glycosyltransferase family 2 protein [Clostridia bacterium]|nr:glycosyltransferase family 2 protein [Clostridia bacterium]